MFKIKFQLSNRYIKLKRYTLINYNRLLKNFYSKKLINKNIIIMQQ